MIQNYKDPSGQATARLRPEVSSKCNTEASALWDKGSCWGHIIHHANLTINIAINIDPVNLSGQTRCDTAQWPLMCSYENASLQRPRQHWQGEMLKLNCVEKQHIFMSGLIPPQTERYKGVEKTNKGLLGHWTRLLWSQKEWTNPGDNFIKNSRHFSRHKRVLLLFFVLYYYYYYYLLHSAQSLTLDWILISHYNRLQWSGQLKNKKSKSSHIYIPAQSGRPSVRPTVIRIRLDLIQREAQWRHRSLSVDGRISALRNILVHIPANTKKEDTHRCVPHRMTTFCLSACTPLSSCVCVVARHWLPLYDGVVKKRTGA